MIHWRNLKKNSPIKLDQGVRAEIWLDVLESTRFGDLLNNNKNK